MPKGPLSKSNPYLREAADLKAVLRNSVITSTAIEGVHGVLPKAYRPSRKKKSGLPYYFVSTLRRGKEKAGQR
jgi:hypothetical protein